MTSPPDISNFYTNSVECTQIGKMSLLNVEKKYEYFWFQKKSFINFNKISKYKTNLFYIISIKKIKEPIKTIFFFL